ncbi:MAG: Uncharacterized protein FD156_1773 [Nitrospirae bacterium]|nr:MAG: Uncharacterized protein FD156_1773 [Nitrospirota bacterium]
MLSLSYLYAFTPLIGLLLNVFAQLIGFRYIKFSLLKSLILGFIIGLLFVFGAGFYGYFALAQPSGEFMTLFIVNSLTYLALSYCYAHFINLGEGARRIRIIRELYKSETGLTMGELLKIYNGRQMVENRINRLMSGGQIILRDNRYFIGKPHMLLISRIILLMKMLLLGKRSEFE